MIFCCCEQARFYIHESFSEHIQTSVYDPVLHHTKTHYRYLYFLPDGVPVPASPAPDVSSGSAGSGTYFSSFNGSNIPYFPLSDFIIPDRFSTVLTSPYLLGHIYSHSFEYSEYKNRPSVTVEQNNVNLTPEDLLKSYGFIS